MINLYNDDCLNILKTIDSDSIDSIVTDPPYGLSFMGKKWDYDVPSQEIWEECHRVLKPGGYVLAFAGSRTYHRMAVRIEDAGFEIRDQIMWIYGSGFPKSHNIGKAYDKKMGNERKFVGTKITGGIGRPTTTGQKSSVSNPNHSVGQKEIDETKGNSQWEGWGTALKPAHEPIVMARKPLIGTVVDNILEHGTGGINIDGCRVKYSANNPPIRQLAQGKTEIVGNKTMYDGQSTNNSKTKAVIGGSLEGRFPSNVILSHHPDCECIGTRKVKSKQLTAGNRTIENGKGWGTGEGGSSYKKGTGAKFSGDGTEMVEEYNCHPDCPIQIMDEQSGNTTSTKGKVRSANIKNTTRLNNSNKTQVNCEYDDTGGASRFFYCAKVSRSERNLGLKDMPDIHIDDNASNPVGLKSGVNSSSIDNKRNPNLITKNNHPTVKPIKLMKYLQKLVTPKNGTTLDPFMGSGTSGISSQLEGFNFIGIEMNEEYYDIAKKRIKNYDLHKLNDVTKSKIIKNDSNKLDSFFKD